MVVNSSVSWHVWIDRGGTFTDCVAVDATGRVYQQKLLSDNPEKYADAPLEAVRRLLVENPGSTVADVRMGTTVATNALLTRTGEPTALVITRGFADLPEIGDQSRPDLFALSIEKPAPVAMAVVEFSGRVTADGNELDAPDWDALTRDLMRARTAGATAVAVSLLHGDRYSAHEQRIREIAQSIGFAHVSLGSEVSALPRLLGRTDTAIVDAYLTPVLRRYVRQFRDGVAIASATAMATAAAWAETTSASATESLPALPRIRFMQSSGGLVDADAFAGKDAILSGPAAGVVGMAKVAELAGFKKAIGWDMGGTSTDVSHLDRTAEALAIEAGGGFDRVEETTIAGVRVRAESLNIVTVAAGGGSILNYEFGRLTVGPQSAGANPGPACYRHGGPLTVTDANLLLGRLRPEHFPKIFGPTGDRPLDAEIVRKKFDEMVAAMAADAGETGLVPASVEDLAAGFLRVANENMAKPIKALSVAQGRNIRDYALISFGGAGGQHACAIAAMLGVQHIVVHPLAAVLSAWGLGYAPVQRILEAAIGTDLADTATLETAEKHRAELTMAGVAAIRAEGIAQAQIEARVAVKLRFQGTDTRLAVACGTTIPTAAMLRDALDLLHRQRFGFVPENAAVIVESVSVEIIGHAAVPADPEMFSATDENSKRELGAADAAETGRVFFDGEWRDDTPIFARADLRRGDKLSGPALVVEPHSTTVVEPGFTATIDARGLLVIARAQTITENPEAKQRALVSAADAVASTTAADPILLEVFSNRFMSIAEQMGASLRKTARSTNIKERLDFSCAVFDGNGGLVANAPHIPVHLGAMGEAVKAIASQRRGQWRPGDCVATNDPNEGGSHLPDITVVTPVFADDENFVPTGDFSALVGRSPAMRAMWRAMDDAIQADPAPVLIAGPPGGGKKLVAKLLHDNGRRAQAPMVRLNCAEVAPEDLPGVLFGTSTGKALHSRISEAGAFDDAGEGTLILDAIHALPVGVQAALVHVLHIGEFRRPGSDVKHPVRARIIATTDRDLTQRIQRGKFRDDLFFLLAANFVLIPVLAGRRDDIRTLSDVFFADEFAAHKRPVLPISTATRDILERFDWPGNVRQLRTAISVIVARTAADAQRVSSRAVPDEIRHSRALDAREIRIEGENENDIPASFPDPLFFVASRGHHSDVGGITPGSMPPFSRKLAEEGVVLRNFTLSRDGRFREAAVRERLSDGNHAARTPDDNVADLKAQMAANETGVRELHRLIAEFSLRTVRRYMGHVQRNATEAVRQVLAELPKHTFEFADHLDDGSRIGVRISVAKTRDRATIDFTGTTAQLPGNLNAPPAVTVAAILYVFRLLVRRPIPLNAGCLAPLEIVIPRGSMLFPSEFAAVSGGNVETSQRVVDVLLGAFGAAAASQGTMNNFTFGNERYQYYETICGGSGATETAAGASAVHTHMTNTRITDPETLERRFPVRLRRFAIRRGSGGKGQFNGGDGVIREFEFLDTMHAALVAERRAVAPYGLLGGLPGERGYALLVQSDGTELPLPGKFEIEVRPGDRLAIHTPGAGGFGRRTSP